MKRVAAASRCLFCSRPGPVGVVCTACGLPRPGLADDPPPARPCAFCASPLAPVDLSAGARVYACLSCRWAFLPPHAWSRAFDAPGLAAELEARVPLPTIRVEEIRPLAPCPACGLELDRARFAATSDVVIDACRRLHGVWLDVGALAKVVAYAEHKMKVGEEAAVREAEDAWTRAAQAERAAHMRVALDVEREERRPVPIAGIGFFTALVLLALGAILVFAGLKMLGPTLREEAPASAEEEP